MNKEIQYDASVDAQMEDRSRVEIIRDETQRVSTQYGERGRITGYTYYISIRNKPALSGNLTREEMDLMYRLYSNEGDNLTQRSIARLFPHITFQDFKRILKAFNITKASAPIAPHLIEEKSTDELVMLHHQNDETKFLRRIEQDREKQTEKQLKEISSKYFELKRRISDFSEFLQGLDIQGRVEIRTPIINTTKTIVVYLSDMHVGADVSKDSVYINDFNAEEAKKRMDLILNRIKELAVFTGASNIVVCNLGDSLDGYNNETTRGGHFLPQNMNNKEQFAIYIQLMVDFFAELSNCGLFANIKYYCVPGGNHDGDFGYITNKALEGYLYKLNPNIEVSVFNKFMEQFNCCSHTFILCHGKDEKDMFKNLPLTLNDKTENLINEYLEYKNISGKVHFVKGDLHQSATTYGKRFRYKSVSSFFGSSEWIHKNMGNTKAACDIDIIDGDNILETRLVLN